MFFLYDLFPHFGNNDVGYFFLNYFARSSAPAGILCHSFYKEFSRSSIILQIKFHLGEIITVSSSNYKRSRRANDCNF